MAIKRRGLVSTTTASGKVRTFSLDGNGTKVATGRQTPKSGAGFHTQEGRNKSKYSRKK